MSKTAKAFGHPIHQMLIVFPLGLLATSVIFDILYFGSNEVNFAIASYYTMAAGIVGAILAAIFGLADWLNIPAGTRAKSVGLWHGSGNFVITLLFLTSWYLRRGSLIPDSTTFTLSLIGVLMALVTGWLGGELVNRLGIGVDEGANPNAPSSLRTGHIPSEHLPSEQWRHSH
jgi:uncharacterized membrane protein